MLVPAVEVIVGSQPIKAGAPHLLDDWEQPDARWVDSYATRGDELATPSHDDCLRAQRIQGLRKRIGRRYASLGLPLRPLTAS